MKTATRNRQFGYKLLRVRKDGSLGSLFINRRARLVVGREYEAGAFPTRGFAVRPGWHITAAPVAPHLGMKDRQWYRVAFWGDVKRHVRPASQGGLWYTAKFMKIITPIDHHQGAPSCRG